MAKLTKQQQRELTTILENLKRAHAFVQSPRIVVCTKKERATTTQDFTRADGQVVYPIDKVIGSDLTGLQSGCELLESFLAIH